MRYAFCSGSREINRRARQLAAGIIRPTREPAPSAALLAARERNEATSRAAVERAGR